MPYEIRSQSLSWQGTPSQLLEIRRAQELEAPQTTYPFVARVGRSVDLYPALLDSPQESICLLLSQLGEDLGADRVSLFSLFSREGHLLMRRQYGWQTQEINVERDWGGWGKTGSLVAYGLDLWEESLKEGEISHAHVRDLPARQSAILCALGIRSLLVAPVFVRGAWWGILQVDVCQQERFWSEEDIYFVRGIAGLLGAVLLRQEASEIISALLQNEVEARKRAATLFEASLSLGSIMDWDVTLDRVLYLLREIVPFDVGSIILVEGDYPTIVRVWETSKGAGRILRNPPLPVFSIEKTEFFYPILKDGKPLLVRDTAAHAEWISPESNPRIRSWMGIPIRFENQIVGFLSLGCNDPLAYTEEHLGWAFAYAQAAGRALQNARLFEGVAQALVSEQRLNEISRLISSTSDLGNMLQSVLKLTTQLVSADMGTLGLYNSEDEVLIVANSFNTPRPLFQTRLIKGQGVAWEVLLKKSSLMLREYAEHPQALAEWVQMGVHAYLGVPLIAGEEVLGVINLFKLSPQRAFQERDRILAEIVGRQTGVAIQNVRRFEQAQRLATRDALTGLYTRRHFFEVARLEFERSRRYQRPIAVILLDIDNLKPINDTYGHPVGDTVLQKVAQVCLRLLRQMDVVGRYGGDEFIVLLPEASREQALQIAERLRGAVEAIPLSTNGNIVSISISQGVAASEKEYTSLEQLVEYADRALNQAKQRGKNQVVVWDSPR
ncbi:diguanylate cyclase [uncultured Thermanaerothrix sp.]|uniref:sensor domain-containing diguanylate cyclase n=1 Tax=uncultured Thermanaerothrix sp. TaxID=1195149 RepID=UPI002605E979|nr:diguanylate cyclase [uncultured Thermanaerothrix sp.]